MTDEPTIFISHSTSKLPATDDSVRVKEALQHALRDDGWHVFVDSHSITDGALWRTEILHSLATAKAGIVLLNDEATKSDWVQAETLIMCFRKFIEPTFPFLPIVLPGASIDATFLKRFEAFEFNEIQRSIANFTAGDSIEAFARTIADKDILKNARKSAPAGVTWVQRVADILSGLKHDVLGRAAKRVMLEPEPGLITPTNCEEFCLRLRWALANLMHHKQTGVCLDVLSELMGVLTKEKANQLEPHIMSKWVENESAAQLLLALRTPEEQGLLTLNTSRQTVADWYAKRLKAEVPPTKFISVISLAQPNGDFDETVLLQKVEEAIREKLAREPSYDKHGNEMSLDDAVSAALESADDFALAVLPMQFAATPLLKKLRARFSRIVFIAMAGEYGQQTAQCIAAGGRALTPDLTPEKRNELAQLSRKWLALFDQHFPN